VPNIIVGTKANISFLDFFLVASPYVLVMTIVTIWMGAKLFRIQGLKTGEERARARELVGAFDENDGVESKFFFWFGAVMLLAFIGVIASASVLPWIKELGMGYVAMSFGLIMLLRYKAVADRFYQAVDWDLLGFFAALFVVINVMEHAQVLHLIGEGLAKIIELGPTTGAGLVLGTAAVASSVTDNIPLAAMLAQILGENEAIAGEPLDPRFWWSVIFGANLGGNLTPIGSASTLVAVTIIHKHELSLSFAQFVRTAFPYAVVQLLFATVYVLLFIG
jgi:Na+/H+ antiporter NhaD/arsenite permease-like protein